MNVLFLGLYMNSLIVCLCIVFFFLNGGIVLYECNYRTDIFFLLYSSFDQRPFQRPLTSRVKLSPFVEQYGVFPISFTLFFSSHLLFFSHPSFLHSSTSGSVPAAHKSSICSGVAMTFGTCFHKLMLWKMNPNLWNSAFDECQYERECIKLVYCQSSVVFFHLRLWFYSQ